MSKKTVKIISMLLTFLMVISLSVSVFAIDISDFEGNTDGNAANSIKDLSKNIIGLLQVAGMAVSIIVLIVLGIKYMMGSTAEKAEYKKTLMPYFVGALLIFGASAFAGVAIDFAENLKPATPPPADGNTTSAIVNMITGKLA